MADDPTPEERAQAWLKLVSKLHVGLKGIGLSDEEQICGLIQTFFELEIIG